MKELYKVVDLSHHNININWCTLAKNVKGVILKCGGSESVNGIPYKDKMFEEYYEKAKLHGLLVGCYFFGVGNTSEKGIYDAYIVRDIIMFKHFELPVFLDYECSKTTISNNSNNISGNTSYVKAFCETLEKFGYWVGIYGSDISTFKSLVNKNDLLDYTWWVAKYSDKEPTYAIENCQLWQYTSSDKNVCGNGCNTDVSRVYVDFAKIIKEKGLNGF